MVHVPRYSSNRKMNLILGLVTLACSFILPSVLAAPSSSSANQQEVNEQENIPDVAPVRTHSVFDYVEYP